MPTNEWLYQGTGSSTSLYSGWSQYQLEARIRSLEADLRAARQECERRGQVVTELMVLNQEIYDENYNLKVAMKAILARKQDDS